MRSNRLIAFVAIVGLTVVSTNAPALEPPFNITRAIQPEAGPAAPGDHTGVATFSDACPATSVGVLSDGSTIVGSTLGSADDFVAGCGSKPGGRDEIFEFGVDFPGLWLLDTCTVPACWDTTLEVREETGGGCPGDFIRCDAGRCNVCYYESSVAAFLLPSNTYYLIVDGWSTFAYGDFTVTATLAFLGCTSDEDCDDGLFCNGAETCDTATGQCSFRSPHPCTTYEGYTAPCDDDLDSCLKPDDCFSWVAGAGSGYFFPEANHCPDLASWVLDDVQGSHHTTGVLDFYTTPLLARSTPYLASPVGTAFLVNQALFTVEDRTCNPREVIAGSTCTGAATVDPSGSPAHDLPCSGTMPLLPNNSGDFDRCEIDFFMAYRTTENGAGFSIAAQKPLLGGRAASDEFGVTVIWLEDCPPTGQFGVVLIEKPDDRFLDFATAVVCQKPGGSCCMPDGSCSLTSEADCAAFGGTFGFTGTIHGTDGGCGGDPDLDGLDNRCGDNCEDDANPGQEDCDRDGFGDACDPEGDADGEDGDGVCQGVDNCPLINNPDQTDTDGDVVGDLCDECPIDFNDDSDGDGVCDSNDICQGFDDHDDGDGDGVPGNGDGCDQCPDSDDNVPGARDDADGDGVLNCNDKCNGVDDAVFAPNCVGAIPTTSQWGLIVLALLLLASGKILFGLGAKRVARS